MKRATDLVIGIPVLVLASPFIALAAIAVKLDTKGPALYRGVRVGLNGKVFHIHKLRSMVAKADQSGPAVTSADDPRITRVGRFLRRTRFDEVPQLWNVIAGEMSLVGPRPESLDFVEQYTPEQRRVLSVRPGITSPTSLAFHDEERMLAERGGAPAYLEAIMPRKLEMDLAYVDRHSTAGDLRILGRTIAFAVTRLFRQ